MSATEAGPEMNVAIARFMGDAVCDSLASRDMERDGPCSLYGKNHFATDEVSNYSGDFAAAWSVVEKILPHIPGRIAMDVMPNHCEVSFTLGDDTQCRGEGETLALAICRAVLAVVVPL